MKTNRKGSMKRPKKIVRCIKNTRGFKYDEYYVIQREDDKCYYLYGDNGFVYEVAKHYFK